MNQLLSDYNKQWDGLVDSWLVLKVLPLVAFAPMCHCSLWIDPSSAALQLCSWQPTQAVQCWMRGWLGQKGCS